MLTNCNLCTASFLICQWKHENNAFIKPVSSVICSIYWSIQQKETAMPYTKVTLHCNASIKYVNITSLHISWLNSCNKHSLKYRIACNIAFSLCVQCNRVSWADLCNTPALLWTPQPDTSSSSSILGRIVFCFFLTIFGLVNTASFDPARFQRPIKAAKVI